MQWDDREWHGETNSALLRRDRRSGPYRSYVPGRLQQLPLRPSPEGDRRLAQAETAVRKLAARAEGFPAIARLLLRSESIASSRIEGIAPSARNVALAELGQTETVQGVNETAQLVANNMTIVHQARTRLVRADLVTVDDIVELHRSLLPEEGEKHGLRERQNWIGGSHWHPLDADFVPPSPERVPDAMQDLVDFANGATFAPILQAAVVHAQFETIHPFADGNGRVGRALIHTVLARRGLSAEAVLPISLVLATHSTAYIDALQAFRLDEDNGVERWLSTFAEAAITASAQAHRMLDDLDEIRMTWDERVQEFRAQRGRTRALRSDSATTLVLDSLLGTPVLTVNSVQSVHGVSRGAAQKAVEDLRDAGILIRRAIGRGRYAYLAGDVLDAVTVAERQLASTRFDTRVSPPRPGVPALPRDHA